jgi:hypothetical protein
MGHIDNAHRRNLGRVAFWIDEVLAKADKTFPVANRGAGSKKNCIRDGVCSRHLAMKVIE